MEHDHIYLGQNHSRNERRVWWVIALTTAMMVAEIIGGTLWGSMALVADGWHMATHAGAMLIAALAYGFARKQARNPRFTFGTGKVGDLAGFASAIVLALVALMIAYESALRLADPVPIAFSQAIVVAVLGLAINLVSAWLLRDDHHQGGHHHQDGHRHDHHHGHDNNLRGAYLHVIADALTSVLAIVALTLGWLYGWLWLDPAMGIVGAMVIARWSWSLIRTTGLVLMDAVPAGDDVPGEIRTVLETDGDRITDLHVWQVGPGHCAAIIALATPKPQTPAFYKQKLAVVHELSHITVEVAPVDALLVKAG